LKLTKSQLEKIKLATTTQAALDLFKRSKAERIVLDTPNGHHVEIDRKKKRESAKDSQAPAILDKFAFSEAYKYLENAKARLDTKTLGGYSNCKADCRNALMSALKTLTGKDTIREATKELHRQGILGEREEEFTKTFDNLLGILHGIDSKKGSHPPMERSEDDAKLALNITTSVIDYIVNQCMRLRV
jgi:hypothetical protein